MRTGSEGGFSYVAVLFALAFFGIGLAQIGMLSSHANRREAEAELIRAGREVERAIASYYRASPGSVPSLPEDWGDLLEDRRFVGVRRHLRRIPLDPMTRSREWGIDRMAGGMAGIHSVSEARPLRTRAIEIGHAVTGGERYADWKFVFIPEEARP